MTENISSNEPANSIAAAACSQKYPTTGFRSLLQGSNLLEILMKPMEGKNGESLEDFGQSCSSLLRAGGGIVCSTSSSSSSSASSSMMQSSPSSSTSSFDLTSNYQLDVLNDLSSLVGIHDFHNNHGGVGSVDPAKSKTTVNWENDLDDILEAKTSKSSRNGGGSGAETSPSKIYGNAFLGPSLWDKTDLFQGSVKFEHLEIDEFLNENGLNETDVQFLDQIQKLDSLTPTICASSSSSSSAVVLPPVQPGSANFDTPPSNNSLAANNGTRMSHNSPVTSSANPIPISNTPNSLISSSLLSSSHFPMGSSPHHSRLLTPHSSSSSAAQHNMITNNTNNYGNYSMTNHHHHQQHHHHPLSQHCMTPMATTKSLAPHVQPLTTIIPAVMPSTSGQSQINPVKNHHHQHQHHPVANLSSKATPTSQQSKLIASNQFNGLNSYSGKHPVENGHFPTTSSSLNSKSSKMTTVEWNSTNNSMDSMSMYSDEDDDDEDEDEEDIDPRLRKLSDEELRPQPVLRKSKKQFVPSEMKDDKYWTRRRKNNIAAKRSRDARRMKENQIAIRASYLERENDSLRKQLDESKRETKTLKIKIAKYESIYPQLVHLDEQK